jgi:modulator of FtsH protease HflC
MKRNLNLILLSILIGGVFVLLQVVFTLRQGEVAVVTRLGKPVRALTEGGLYGRWPWPIQKVYRYDNRIRLLEGAFEESLTHDGKNVLIASYAGWRIADPVKFLERVGTPERAQDSLDGLLRTHRNSILGQYRFRNLINEDPSQLKLDEMERQVLDAVQPPAKERYGIEVLFVGIRQTGLPEAITQAVFDRMRAERQQLADRYRSEGEGEAIRIRAEADSRRDQTLAQAEADAKRLKAEGDAAAAGYYQVFAKDPELAIFLRKLEVMEETLKEKSTVILSAETEPFDLLRGRGRNIQEEK